MNSIIEFLCSDEYESHFGYIMNVLPKTKTKVMDVSCREDKLLRVRLYTACYNVEDIKSWIKKYEETTKTTFSIRATVKCQERYLTFKRILKCQHNTFRKEVCELTQSKRNKNCKCPATMTVCLHSIKKRYKGKDMQSYLIRKNMPCEISLVLTHNHPTESAEALQFRKVAPEVREKLLQLFHQLHSPATALEMLKSEICLSIDDPEFILADRQQCPDYYYSYHLYTNKFIKTFGPIDFTACSKEFLGKKIEEYNDQSDGDSARLNFVEKGYIICICPPIMKRTHEYIQASSDIVLIDSSGTLDHIGSKIFILLTPSDCGGLPLGIIITTSESCEAIKLGFKLLINMVGKKIFGGHPEGPKVFVTDDSQAEQAAINNVWPSSKCILCTFHVLQSIRRWLSKSNNRIPKEHQDAFLEQFKSIMHAETVEDCVIKYEAAQNNAVGYPNYQIHLGYYWQRKEMWVLFYRSSDLTLANNKNNLTEPVMCLVKETIFNRIRSNNIIQMLDFILTIYVDYYKKRLQDAANNYLRKYLLGKITKKPPDGLLERIKFLKKKENLILVPSTESSAAENTHYLVDMNALTCTCSEENSGKRCEHIDWASLLLFSETYNKPLKNTSMRRIFSVIATGEEPPSMYLDVPKEESSAASSDPQTIQLSMARVSSSFDKIQLMCMEFFKESPVEVAAGLETLHENLEKVRTPSDFVASCADFAMGYRQEDQVGAFPFQMRETDLSDHNENAAKRPKIEPESDVETIKIIICP